MRAAGIAALNPTPGPGSVRQTERSKSVRKLISIVIAALGISFATPSFAAVDAAGHTIIAGLHVAGFAAMAAVGGIFALVICQHQGGCGASQPGAKSSMSPHSVLPDTIAATDEAALVAQAAIDRAAASPPQLARAAR